MAKYKVEYTTTSKPSALSLPVGAKITQTSVLPAVITGVGSIFGTGKVRVEKSAGAGDAFLQVSDTYDSTSVRLTKAQAKDVIAALQEIVNA